MAQKHPCSDEVKEGVGEGAGAEDAREMMVGGTGDTDGAQQKVSYRSYSCQLRLVDNVQPGPGEGECRQRRR